MAIQEKNSETLKKVVTCNGLRTEETTKRYIEFLESNTKKNCIFCDRELFVKEFEHWVILENRFPYDKIAQTHHMLAPKRHIAFEADLTLEERDEMIHIKQNELASYGFVLESVPRCSSIPDHFHTHLLKYHNK